MPPRRSTKEREREIIIWDLSDVRVCTYVKVLSSSLSWDDVRNCLPTYRESAKKKGKERERECEEEGQPATVSTTTFFSPYSISFLWWQ